MKVELILTIKGQEKKLRFSPDFKDLKDNCLIMSYDGEIIEEEAFLVIKYGEDKTIIFSSGRVFQDEDKYLYIFTYVDNWKLSYFRKYLKNNK